MFVVLGLKGGITYEPGSPLKFHLAKDGVRVGGEHVMEFDRGPFASLPAAQVLPPAHALDDGAWRVSLDGGHVDSLQAELVVVEDVGGVAVKTLNPAAIEDVWFVIEYGIRS